LTDCSNLRGSLCFPRSTLRLFPIF